MSGCAAVFCHNSQKKGFRVFRFPRDKERMAVWVNNCRRDKWTPTRHSVLCEVHFESSQFESHRADGRKLLKPNAVPTLFSVPNQSKQIGVQRKSSYKEIKKTAATSVLNDGKSDANTESNTEFIISEGSPASNIELTERLTASLEEVSQLRLILLKTNETLATEEEKYEAKLVKVGNELEEKSASSQKFLNDDQINCLSKKKMRQLLRETRHIESRFYLV